MDDIVEVLRKSESVPLKDIETETGINKGTLCNILKSLVELGYVSRIHGGNYSIGNKLLTMTGPETKYKSLIPLAQEYAYILAEKTHESSMLSVLTSNQELRLISKSVYEQSVIVNTNLFSNLTFFKSASGLAYMAFDESLDLQEIYKKYKDKMIYKSYEEYIKKIEVSRKKGFSTIDLESKQAIAMAAPVFNSNKKVIAAMGLNAPLLRVTKAKKAELSKILLNLAAEMTEVISM
jgi:DNA-binding IclR family transcriptional regulator